MHITWITLNDVQPYRTAFVDCRLSICRWFFCHFADFCLAINYENYGASVNIKFFWTRNFEIEADIMLVMRHLRTNTCGPTFTDRHLRTDICGPTFADDIWGPTNFKKFWLYWNSGAHWTILKLKINKTSSHSFSFCNLPMVILFVICRRK